MFAALARTADIIITDFQRLSADESDRLAKIAFRVKPAIIFTEVWPFGRGNSCERDPATDTTLQALGGHLFLNGDIDRSPVRIGLPVAIMQGRAEAASAALMAYYHRLRTGVGQRVDISIQECVIWTLLNTTMAWQILGIERDAGRRGAKGTRQSLLHAVWFGPAWMAIFSLRALSGGGRGVGARKIIRSLGRLDGEEGID